MRATGPNRIKQRPKSQIDFARRLRKASPEAELKLWKQLSARQVRGAKFRRNEPIGKYVVDFYCHESGLVIELDGGGHFTDEAIGYDKKRTAWLEDQGLRVIRFSNDQVFKQFDSVVEQIWNELGQSPSP